MFLEGYLFDKDKGKEAFLQAARLPARQAARPASPFPIRSASTATAPISCGMIGNELDYVIGNEDEITIALRDRRS